MATISYLEKNFMPKDKFYLSIIKNNKYNQVMD